MFVICCFSESDCMLYHTLVKSNLDYAFAGSFELLDVLCFLIFRFRLLWFWQFRFCLVFPSPYYLFPLLTSLPLLLLLSSPMLPWYLPKFFLLHRCFPLVLLSYFYFLLLSSGVFVAQLHLLFLDGGFKDFIFRFSPLVYCLHLCSILLSSSTTFLGGNLQDLQNQATSSTSSHDKNLKPAWVTFALKVQNHYSHPSNKVFYFPHL